MNFCFVILQIKSFCFKIDFCSSIGQNLMTSTYVGEIDFAIVIAILGLVLFALLIGNMQVSLGAFVFSPFIFC